MGFRVASRDFVDRCLVHSINAIHESTRNDTKRTKLRMKTQMTSHEQTVASEDQYQLATYKKDAHRRRAGRRRLDFYE